MSAVLRRARTPLLALGCFAVAAFLLVLALDARAWGRRMTQDDLRFRALHSHVALWTSPSALPGDPAQRLLGLGEPLAFRRALQVFWYSRVGSDPLSRRDLPSIRIDAQARLQKLIVGGRDGAERSDAANLLGVLTVTTPSTEATTQVQTLRRAAGYFQQAILEDPSDYAAKLNLELVLRLLKPGDSRFGKKARGGYGLSKGLGKGHGVTAIGTGY
jgi:hypothetical protein